MKSDVGSIDRVAWILLGGHLPDREILTLEPLIE